jgi:hypothetical protein
MGSDLMTHFASPKMMAFVKKFDEETNNKFFIMPLVFWVLLTFSILSLFYLKSGKK